MVCAFIHMGSIRVRFKALGFILATAFLIPFSLKSQTKISYNVFNKSPLGGITVNIPMLNEIEALKVNPMSGFSLAVAPTPSFTVADADRDIYEHERQKQVQEELVKEAMNAGRPEVDYERFTKTAPYYKAFKELLKMNPDSFSIIKAIYTVENAYNNDPNITFDVFKRAIEQRATLVRQILKKEGLNTKDNLALNYGIQRLFSRTNTFYDAKKKETYSIPPLKYDFEDYRGEKDYTKMFVTKVLKTGSGQCHSLPLLYLALAESLGAKAWLSLAPQHSFIQFKDKQGKLINLETTNGQLVSSSWLTQSGYINAMALQNKTYMDTLSSRQLYSQMMADLMLGYMHKFGYDIMADDMRQAILKVNPNNLTAKIVDANIKTSYALARIKQAGKPKEEDLPKYPMAYQAYLDMQASYASVDNTGYQDMPSEAYQAWLKSLEREKKSQKVKELQEKMRREIEALKKLKITFQNNLKQ